MSRFINSDITFTLNDGTVNALGTVYFGEPNLNAIANPKTPYLDDELTTPAAATQSLTAGGKITAELFLDGNYSIIVHDASAVQVDEILDYAAVSGQIGIGSLPDAPAGSIDDTSIFHTLDSIGRDVKAPLSTITALVEPVVGQSILQLDTGDRIAIGDLSDGNQIKGISETNFFGRTAANLIAAHRIAVIDTTGGDNLVTSVPQSEITAAGGYTHIVEPQSVSMTVTAQDTWELTPILPGGIVSAVNMVRVDMPEGESNTTVYGRNDGSTLGATAATTIGRVTSNSIGSVDTIPILLDSSGRFELRSTRFPFSAIDLTVVGYFNNATTV